MKKVLSFFLMIALLFSISPTPSFAADDKSLVMSKLEVQVMPELDNPEGWPANTPSLLTGIYGTLENTGASVYDGKVQIKIAAAKDVKFYLVAELQGQGNPEKTVPYDYNAEKGIVTWQPSKPLEKGKPYEFVVEYYSNPMKVNGEERSFDFAFTPSYEVKDAQFFLFEPLDAQLFTPSEQTKDMFQTDFGQKIYKYAKGPMKVQDQMKLAVQYKKADFETTLFKQQKLQQEKAAAPGAGTAVQPGEPKSSDTVFMAVIIAISIVIFGVLLFFGLRGRQPVMAGSKVKPAKNAPKSSDNEIRILRKKLLEGKLSEEEYMNLRKQFE